MSDIKPTEHAARQFMNSPIKDPAPAHVVSLFYVPVSEGIKKARPDQKQCQ